MVDTVVFSAKIIDLFSIFRLCSSSVVLSIVFLRTFLEFGPFGFDWYTYDERFYTMVCTVYLVNFV